MTRNMIIRAESLLDTFEVASARLGGDLGCSSLEDVDKQQSTFQISAGDNYDDRRVQKRRQWGQRRQQQLLSPAAAVATVFASPQFCGIISASYDFSSDFFASPRFWGIFGFGKSFDFDSSFTGHNSLFYGG
jgi:hypothetical protein